MNITNTLRQSLARSAFCLLGLLLGLTIATLPASSTTTIVPDTWYSAKTAGGTSMEGGGTEFGLNSGTGFQHILTYFRQASLPIVGDSLSVSLIFSAKVGANSRSSEYPFGFAFYNSGGNQISANNLGQNGGSPSPYNAYRGYRVSMNTATRTQQSPLRLMSRSGTNAALISNSAHIAIAGSTPFGSLSKTLESDTLYTATYTVTRTVAGLDFTFSITGGELSNLNGSWSVASTSDGFTTIFDTFAISMQSSTIFDSITLHDISITRPATTTLVPHTWYSAKTAGGISLEGGGTQFGLNSGTGFQHVLTYFGSTSLPSVGDSLSVSLTFSAEVGTNSVNAEYPFGFAFYNSGGNQISANNLGQNGGGPSPYNAYRGYRVSMNTATRTQQSPLRLMSRSGANAALISNSAHVAIAGSTPFGSLSKTLESDTLYTATYTVTRTATGLDFTFSITGGELSNLNGSWSVTSTSDGFATAFDTFAISMQSSTIFDSITLHDVSITRPDPEVYGLELKPGGDFTFDLVSVSAAHYDQDWRYVGQRGSRPAPGYPKADGTVWTTSVALQPKSVTEPITLNQWLELIDDTSFSLSLNATHPTGVPTREMFVELGLPPGIAAGKSIFMNGMEIQLPAAYGGTVLFSDYTRVQRTLVIPSATGTVTIEGMFTILVQDRRQSRPDASFEVRLRFSSGAPTLTDADFDATFYFTPHLSTPISLRDAANFGFRDDVAGDGLGGWTDQGANNDLRMLPAGPLQAAGVTFDIIDADANGGRSAIVLGRADQPFLPNSVEIAIPSSLASEAEGWRSLYLLHAAAELPPAGELVGRVIVRHTDGLETIYEIISGRDVGNWWSPNTLSNGAVGWRGSNPSSEVGLYVSRIPIDGGPVESIRLESAGTAMWMIAGVSGSVDNIMPVSSATPWTVTAGPEWAAYDHRLDIVPGSVFDFSSQLDAPAGKHGPLIVTPDGHFAFASRPGVRERFWGVNLVGTSACTPPQNVADRVAENLARSGYNTVRLHHFDRAIQGRGTSSSELKAEELDRLDYLFYALKQRGLYINIDLYASRTILPTEWAAMGMDPMTGANLPRFKYAVPVSDEAFRIWSEFVQNLLTHRNPYTGLTWGEDPALIGICLLNENSPTVFIENDPVIAPLWQQAFATWQTKPGNARKSGETDAQYFNWFVFETQAAAELRMANFVRSLGVDTLLTGTNFRTDQALAFVRQHYDYVDIHQYWGHPSFPKESWQLPYQFQQTSATRFAAKEPRDRFPTRILGTPFTVTEFSYVRPNRYRAEGGVLMPAYAGLQDWDALYNFDYATQSSNIMTPGAVGVFSLAVDPIGLLADRVAAAIFLRGDVEPAEGQIGFAVQPDTAFASQGKRFPDEFSKIGLVTRIGSSPGDPIELLDNEALDAVVVESFGQGTAGAEPIFEAGNALAEQLQLNGVLPPGSISANGKRYVSDTGQIELQEDTGSVKLVTPRSELFILPSQATLEGDRVSVQNGWIYGTVAVVAVDGNPIAQSRRLLVTHLTDALPTGMRFASPERRLQETNGQLPHLVERGSAELTLKLAEGVNYQAWVVSATGARLRQVPLTKTAAGWILQVETVTNEGTQLAYEIEG